MNMEKLRDMGSTSGVVDLLQKVEEGLVWMTADKRIIPIPDLEDGHLCNIIRMLNRDAERNAWDQVNRMSPLISMMGEHAQDGAEEYITGLADEPTRSYGPIYDNLVAEAEKRGLMFDGEFITRENVEAAFDTLWKSLSDTEKQFYDPTLGEPFGE